MNAVFADTLLALMAVLAMASAWMATKASAPLSIVSGLLGAAHLLMAVHSRRPWEAGARRAAYVASHTAGLTLDRAVDAALAASMLAIALAFWTLAPGAAPWPRRVVAVCVCLLASASVIASVLAGQPLR